MNKTDKFFYYLVNTPFKGEPALNGFMQVLVILGIICLL